MEPARRLIVVTSTYALDLHSALRLNRQLVAFGEQNRETVIHTLFVEQRDYDLFEQHKNQQGQSFELRVKPDGGDGGCGRGGSLCRLHLHAQTLPQVRPGDTVANIDSDVFFQNPAMIPDIYCQADETRGFSGWAKTDPNVVLELNDGTRFTPVSGMMQAAGHATYTKAWAHATHESVWNLCQLLMDSGHGCSEDVTAAVLYQTRGCGSFVNLSARWERSVRGPALSRLYPAPEAGYPATADVIA